MASNRTSNPESPGKRPNTESPSQRPPQASPPKPRQPTPDLSSVAGEEDPGSAVDAPAPFPHEKP